jgi:hypothetical protein
MSLTMSRNTVRRDGRVLDFARAASVTCFAGAIGCLNASGLATPGATATTLRAVGRVLRQYTDDAGNVRVEMERGTFKFANSSAGDAITNAAYGSNVFIVNDQTVALTNGSSTRSIAGICRGVDADGVWVEF